MKKDNYGVIIHPKDFEDILSMSSSEAGDIIQNVVKTFLGREDLVKFDDRYLTRVSNEMCERTVWDKDQKDKKSKAGSQGGAPKGNSNAKKQAENNQKTSTKQAETTFNSNSNNKSNINKTLYKPNQFTNGVVPQEYNFPLLEKKLIKN